MSAKKFFLGMHNLDRSWKFDRLFVSANRLWDRVPTIVCDEWVMDSGAFTEISTHGCYRRAVEDYARLIKNFARYKGLVAAVAQDFMCERMICAKVLGQTEISARIWARQIGEHQRMTIERYDALVACDLGGVYLMPVLQGYTPTQYVRHLRQYGSKIAHGAWVGVGSVCKRQGDPDAIVAVLEAIKAERPDIRLHGFGVKLTALRDPRVVELLHSADSMAWSFAARKRKGDQNSDWVARSFEADVLDAMGQPYGEWLAINMRDGKAKRYAIEDNEKAGARRVKRANDNAIWKEIEAKARIEDAKNLARANVRYADPTTSGA